MWLCRRGFNIYVVVYERVYDLCGCLGEGLAFLRLCMRKYNIDVVVYKRI